MKIEDLYYQIFENIKIHKAYFNKYLVLRTWKTQATKNFQSVCNKISTSNNRPFK